MRIYIILCIIGQLTVPEPYMHGLSVITRFGVIWTIKIIGSVKRYYTILGLELTRGFNYNTRKEFLVAT